MSEYDSSFKNKFMFLKFMDDQSHVESLQNGNLRCGTAKIYKDFEKKKGKKGIGDRYDSSLVIVPQKVKFHLSDTIKLEAKANKVSLDDGEIDHMPVFCLYGLNGDYLEVEDQDDEYYYTRTVFDEDDKILLQKDFGEHALLIHPIFLERVAQRMKEQEIKVTHDFVTYHDLSNNDLKKYISYEQNKLNVVFQKDKSFIHQKEYRLLLHTQITDYKWFDIGDIHDCSGYITRENLFTEGFELQVVKNA
ncbi:hypothetical protein RCG23_14060 [Neobacillus sp. PS3-34]|uniref:hypothetical protein n=1 Tax=Neobacillus sp. PS3-34 TaxID=3070678 RepID=UPI0027E1449F|nr:hypothetical protein [Neobacillus sp. PS3-34]WML46765.1 hypothetical protein RCG23_14060 [Neobacillus sp. PS3-34]